MDDMIQDCYSRILKRIGTFKHYKAKFSTWCTHVCRSALNSRYRSNIRYSSRIAEVENIDGLSVVGPEDMMLAKEITDTVKAIAKAHPKKRKILYAMFGNPKKKNFLLPSEVRVAEVARELNVSYSEVYAFHRDVVRPFFKEKFGESYEWIRDV
jgi:RNA polymerase sigma factor (sigma-70 family)